jgi:transposase
MDATLLFPLPEGMLIEDLQATETSLSLTVRATHPTSRCPLCSQASSSTHSHYQRTLADASCAGRQVQLTLIVRRFYCRNRRMSSAKSLRNVSHALSNRGLA